jgi:uncharacterized protein
MTPEERKVYVYGRLKAAYDTLDAAKLLAENKFWNSAVNRLYYAAFYAVNALLFNSEIYAQTHSGVKSQFSLNFVKTGKLDKKFGRLLAELYDWRQKGDYESSVEFDAESVMPLVDRVLEMIEEIEKALSQDF